MYHLSDDLKAEQRRPRAKKQFFWMCLIFAAYSLAAGSVYVLSTFLLTLWLARPSGALEGFPPLRPSIVKWIQQIHFLLAIFFMGSFLWIAPLLLDWLKPPPGKSGNGTPPL